MDLTPQCKQAAEYYTELAKQPGWWQYVRHQVSEIERLAGYEGLRAAVAQALKGFRPAPDEVREWHLD